MSLANIVGKIPKDLWDTASGFLGLVIYCWTYEHSPTLAIGFIGFHIGVVSMRMSRGYFVKKDDLTPPTAELGST